MYRRSALGPSSDGRCDSRLYLYNSPSAGVSAAECTSGIELWPSQTDGAQVNFAESRACDGLWIAALRHLRAVSGTFVRAGFPSQHVGPRTVPKNTRRSAAEHDVVWPLNELRP